MLSFPLENNRKLRCGDVNLYSVTTYPSWCLRHRDDLPYLMFDTAWWNTFWYLSPLILQIQRDDLPFLIFVAVVSSVTTSFIEDIGCVAFVMVSSVAISLNVVCTVNDIVLACVDSSCVTCSCWVSCCVDGRCVVCFCDVCPISVLSCAVYSIVVVSWATNGWFCVVCSIGVCCFVVCRTDVCVCVVCPTDVCCCVVCAIDVSCCDVCSIVVCSFAVYISCVVIFTCLVDVCWFVVVVNLAVDISIGGLDECVDRLSMLTALYDTVSSSVDEPCLVVDSESDIAGGIFVVVKIAAIRVVVSVIGVVVGTVVTIVGVSVIVVGEVVVSGITFCVVRSGVVIWRTVVSKSCIVVASNADCSVVGDIWVVVITFSVVGSVGIVNTVAVIKKRKLFKRT